MAQYFEPLFLARPGEWPAAFVGNVPEVSGASIEYIGPGVNGPSNSLEFIKRGVSGETAHHTCLLGISAADVDILYKARLSPVPASSVFTNTGPVCVAARAAFSSGGGTGRPTDCYYLTNGQSTSNSSSSNQRRVGLWKIVSGGHTELDFATNALPNPTNWENAPPVLARLQCVGTTIRGRMWYEGTSEPDTWQVTATDSSLTSGDVGFIMHGYGQRNAASWFSVGTETDAAPEVPTRVVAGIVREPDSSPAVGYRVNLHDQRSGVLIASMLSNPAGQFEFTINSLSPVYAVAIDQLGNAWKAPIVDRVLPVVP